jgi:hypothetical protein
MREFGPLIHDLLQYELRLYVRDFDGGVSFEVDSIGPTKAVFIIHYKNGIKMWPYENWRGKTVYKRVCRSELGRRIAEELIKHRVPELKDGTVIQGQLHSDEAEDAYKSWLKQYMEAKVNET